MIGQTLWPVCDGLPSAACPDGLPMISRVGRPSWDRLMSAIDAGQAKWKDGCGSVAGIVARIDPKG